MRWEIRMRRPESSPSLGSPVGRQQATKTRHLWAIRLEALAAESARWRVPPAHDTDLWAEWLIGLSRWALRGSNPRPSPCKGEEEVLVRGLSCGFACHRMRRLRWRA